jgi:hypothetical protein
MYQNTPFATYETKVSMNFSKLLTIFRNQLSATSLVTR